MGELFVLDYKNEASEKPSSSEPVDQAAREQALDITRSWIVEAPAGSGKTGLLIQRYLKLLAQPEIRKPEQVLAITFTLKAAGEIRDRVLDELRKATAAKEPCNLQSKNFTATTMSLARTVIERDKELRWGLLDHPSRLNLRTIDSICAEIAQGLPVLSGGSGLKPVENAEPLHRLAAERTLLQLGGSDARLNDALSLLLLHRDGELQRLRDLLAQMLALRDQWGRLIPLDRESLDEAFLDRSVLPQLESTLARAICAELVSVQKGIPSHLLERLSTLAAEMGYNAGYDGELSPIRACAGKHTQPEPNVDDLERWHSLVHLLVTSGRKWRKSFNKRVLQFETDKGQQKYLKEIVSDFETHGSLLEHVRKIIALPPANYPKEQWRVAKALFVVLYRALAELQLVFAERGECDFTELGLLARSALNQSVDDDILLRTELQHLLVDEMQDTSTSQYELIELLTQGWDGHSQTVFLVGDPKQSIYLFRQARVERFIRTMKDLRLGSISLDLLRLTSNFRSQAGLVNSFNETFFRLFPNDALEDRPEEAPYVAAVPVRPLGFDIKHMVWHPQILSAGTPDETASEKQRLARLEALDIRNVIEQWIIRPLPEGRTDPWSIAVLVRSRNHLLQIVAELKRDERDHAAIPFHAVEIEPLSDRPEILDLFALTRALLHPADRVAWLSVLRAPWCGLELADLHILCGQDDPQWSTSTVVELIQERGQLLSEQGVRLLERIGPLLTAVNKQLARLPLSELVERTWRSMGGDTYLTPEERKNTEQYLGLLDQAEQQGVIIDLDRLRQALGRLYAAPSATPGAVDLMTIHGAKGLEWDLVLLPGLAKRSHGDSQKLLTWEELSATDEDESQVILAPIVGTGRDSESLNEWLQDIHRRRENAESRRLFYVACTRAREELHLFATLKRNRDGSLKPEFGTLLAAAWPAAERYFIDNEVPSKPVIAPIVTLRPAILSGVLPAIAAEEHGHSTAATLHRLPEGFVLPRRAAVIPEFEYQDAAVSKTFDRPEGSFEARAFGNTVHALLEFLAQRTEDGSSASTLLREIPDWQPRIKALLRHHGLPPASLQRLAVRAQQAIVSMLGDPNGRWVIGAHKDATSEHAVVAWDEVRSSVHLDRIFRAGTSPRAEGDECLWIIDFKTTPHNGTSIDEFLNSEREKYTSQMEFYAQIMRGALQPKELRLGLYYPLIPRLIWWSPEE
jgi:ATP-dependent exoDNAse (exonuclease V) beta subunit